MSKWVWRAAPKLAWAKAGPAIILALAVTSGACAARGDVPRPFPGASIPPGAGDAPPDRVEAPVDRVEAAPDPFEPSAEPAARPTLAAVVAAALGFQGIPYRNGGSDPSGFDCSGFVQYVFARVGTFLPREVRDQYEVGREIDFQDVQAGDLIFFETVSRGASHVGIALGDGRFVHAPSSRGVVRVEPYTASYWARRFVGARRVSDTAVHASVERSRFPGAVRFSK
ncbi:MAG: NlpC/P60 family protein [Acidobacteria bacterium]|nr:NlpC/P60 family protein [Acidobacteriota bacterium]